MTLDIDQMFQKTKGQLFFKKGAGFLGPLLARMNFEWRKDIPTAAVSAKTLYWNPEFFASLDKDTRVTVLAHELWHKAYLHGARRNDRCPDIWNIAADHVINLMLKEHGYYMGGFPYVMDDKYIGMSTDEVYDDLIKPSNQGGGGMVPGQAPQGFMHGDVLPIEGPDKDQAIADVVQATTVARMGKEAGSIPGEITFTVDEFLNPKLPWPTILYQFFNALTEQEYSYRRPNRRYEDPILRGPSGQNGLEHLIYYLDISGSIRDEDILRFNSEVKFIQEELQPERLTLVTFDTKLHDFYEFEKDDPFEKIVVTGRGGTSLTEVFEHMQENAPSAAVIFSDLWVDIPENPGVPIVWICIDNPDAEVPYGKLIHIDE